MRDKIMGGKKVSVLVQEQLQYCRSLRRADMLSVTQDVATDGECLKKANSLIMTLKADVRALNTCAAHLLPPPDGDMVTHAAAGASEVARSAYQVETIERLFRRFRQVDLTNAGASSIKAVSATNQLVVMRERLQAGLSGRLLELKLEMDKEFGTAFVDMESYLRTERDTQAKSDAEHCSACARSFVELCYKFQVMVHACRGLRAAKEGLNQTVLLKALREERDSLSSKLSESERELKRIHHSYTEMMTPEVAVGLENRQRHKIEEQEADLGRLKIELSTQKRDHERLLAENGRLTDTVGELHSQLASNKEQYAREMAWLTPKVAVSENRAAEIDGLVDQMNLKLSLLSSSNKKASEEIGDLKSQLSMARADGPGMQFSSLQQEAMRCRGQVKKLQAEIARKDRLVTIALSARSEACSEYRALKEGATANEKRFREAEAARVLLEVQKNASTAKLTAAEEHLQSREAIHAQAYAELKQTVQDLEMKTQENEILERRLSEQEMELRDFSNLKQEFQALSASKNDLAYSLSTVSGVLEGLKDKAIKMGMGRELGLC